MSQIADSIGIKKPSLYNHFKSKDDIISSMYLLFRDNAKKTLPPSLPEDKSMEEILLFAVSNYMNMSTDGDMLLFYKVIYSERATNPTAARIMAEETSKMIGATKYLFSALKAAGKLNVEDTDTAALSFAMTIHAMLDHQIDLSCCGEQPGDMIPNYIKWFCNNFERK